MDEHLKELLESTPSSQMKLLASWDGLSIETQIKLLHALANGGRLHLTFHRDIIAKALKNPNEYIRYLAARSHDLDKDKEMIEQVAADESPLVRYAQEELRFYPLEHISPQGFWNSPNPKRLAIARAVHPPKDDFARYLMWAVENRCASDDELLNVVIEYVSNPKFKEEDFDRDKALWEIVPKMPEGVAGKLVMNLSDHVFVLPENPESFTRLSGDLGPEAWQLVENNLRKLISVLDWLKGNLLTWFLRREDIRLERFRKRIFFSNDEKYSDENRASAASRNFELSHEEFHALLQQRSARLELLDRVPHNFRLVFLECLKDYFECRPKETEADKGAGSATYWAFYHRMERSYGKLSGQLSWPDRKELRELKIYRLAKSVMPWKGNREENALCEPLKFLADKIVEGDTWATFMAFHTALSEQYDSHAGMYVHDRYLPILPEIGEIESEENEPHAKPARADISRVSRSITPPAHDWLDWAVSILRRMFR